MSSELIQVTPNGLECAAGGFAVDPRRPVERAILTHAHADHARSGSGAYLCAPDSVGLLRRRLGDVALQPLAYGERLRLGDVTVSLHPAGHVLGSAQVRIEGRGADSRRQVWVITGDYKRDADPTCAPFEPVPCDALVTEATFALPVYRWPQTREVARQVVEWWDANREAGLASVLCAYSLGKAQRLLAEIARSTTDREPIRVFTHGAVESMTAAYREEGVELPATTAVSAAGKRSWAGELIVAPPSAAGSPWMKRFGRSRVGFASGWMRVRGARRRRGYDRGFTLSDHADWPGLLTTVAETGAQRVLATHGYSAALARYLREDRGLDAEPLENLFEGDID